MKKKQLKKNLQIEINFWRFVQFLHENNYIVECEEIDKNYFQVSIKNNNIKGFMWIYKSPDNKLNSGVAIDNKKCWNKIADCPFRMKIPNPRKFDAYLERLCFWGSDKGHRFSNNFDKTQFNHDGT
jgi:hypothetical protein